MQNKLEIFIVLLDGTMKESTLIKDIKEIYCELPLKKYFYC